MKKVIVIIGIIFLLFPFWCFAQSNVTYVGTSKKFIFDSTGEEISSLFVEFNDVIPGNSYNESISLKNSRSNEVKINVYFRGTSNDEFTNNLLSNLSLSVNQNHETVLFDSGSNTIEDINDWHLLGTLYSGGNVDLDFILTVPKELGNEYQDSVGTIDWQLKVEELPIEDTDPIVNTYDSIYLYLSLLLICILIIIILVILLKKKEKDINMVKKNKK